MTKQDLCNMTFTPIISKFVEPGKIGDGTTYISMISREIDRTVRWFCPKCIKEQGYYKLLWQVKEIEICDIHLIKLEYICKSCNRPHLYVHKEIGTCIYCDSICHTAMRRTLLMKIILNFKYGSIEIGSFFLSPQHRWRKNIKE
jgi:hypothetical protein